MSAFRGIAPIAIAVAFGVMLLVQMFRTNSPSPSTTTETAAPAAPCQPFLGEPNAASLGTPPASVDSEQELASITTTLVVTAATNGTTLLQPSLYVEEPVQRGEDASDVVALLLAYLPDQEGAVSPDWSRLRSLLVADKPWDPNDVGLFRASASRAATTRRVGIEVPVETTTGSSGAIRLSPLDPADPFIKDIAGPPTIYAQGNHLYVYVKEAEKRLEDGDVWAGGWKVQPKSGGVTLSISAVPTNVFWDAALCVDGFQVLSADPPPDSMDPNLLTWSFPPQPGGTTQEIRVVAEPTQSSWLRQWVNSGSRANLVVAWATLAPAVLLAAGLWFSRRTGSFAPAVEAARCRLIWTTVSVVRLAVAGVMTIVVASSSRMFAPTPEGLDTATQLRHLILLLAVSAVIGLELLLALVWRGARPFARGIARTLAIAAIAGVGVVIVTAAVLNQDFWRQAILSPIQRSLLATAYFAFFASALLMWTGSSRALKQSWRNLIFAIMGTCGLLICAYDLYRMESINRLIPIPTGLDDLVAVLTPIWGTIGIVVGVLLTTAALLPRHVKMLRAISPARHHAVLATIIILAAILAQWLVTLYSRQPFRERAWVQSDPWANGRDFFANQLQGDTSNFLAQFLVPALNLLPLLGLAGLIGMLSAAARSNPEDLTENDDLWVERVLKFLFAAFVIGYGGAVLGLRTPIAFLIGLLVLPFAWNPRSSASSDGGDRIPDDAEPDGTEETAEPGFPRPPTLQGLAASGWWQGGALATRLGGGIAVAPVTFFIILFLINAESAAWSTSSPFAMAAFLSAIAYELAFWLVAAFVFGCLYPYLRGENGIIKALALAAVYIGANAAAALIGVSGDALWRVRSFQLLLFLILLGVLLDQKRLPAEQQTWQGLAAHYDLQHAAAWAKNVLPLVSALAAVAIQLLNQNSADAVTNLISGQANNEILAIACKLASESGKVC